MNRTTRILLSAFLIAYQAGATDIIVDASAGHKAIHPGIYGRNNVIGKEYAAKMRDAGIKILRENNGNNSTKYNWKLKLSSHPDWYNNVYANDWDAKAVTIAKDFPGAQGFFGFQLLGKAASTRDHNFDDWGYNKSQWWSGVEQNLAGGGVINSAGGSKATTDGDPALYLKDWPADSSVGILNHWFGTGGLGYDRKNFVYWSMDNEPDIWNGTHDDVIKSPIPAEDFIQKYLTVALAARNAYPEIKLTGPVVANEWQWFNWQSDISYKGRPHSWIEYFIRRIGELQDSTGVRLLDVLDLHFYPGLDGTNPTEAKTMANIHRIWFDTTWDYPKANGVKSINGGWDASITKEYIWKRCQDWLDLYLGKGNGVTFGLTECGNLNNTTAQQAAHWYASHLGVFADNGVELFTPWDWYSGQLEVLNLFTKSAKTTRVLSTSASDSLVSAYSSINVAGDSLSVILVNHSTTSQQSATVSLKNFSVSEVSVPTKTLSGLSGETFVSASANALQTGTVPVSTNSFTVTLEPLAITAVILRTDKGTQIKTSTATTSSFSMNNTGGKLTVMGYSGKILKGKIVRYNGQVLTNFAVPLQSGVGSVSLEGIRGVCVVQFENGITRKLILQN